MKLFAEERMFVEKTGLNSFFRNCSWKFISEESLKIELFILRSSA